MSKYVITVDMGGTKMLASALNSSEGIVARKKIATDVSQGKIDYAKVTADLVLQLINESGFQRDEIASVCIGVPGAVDIHTGVIKIAPNLGLKNHPIKKEIEALLSYPVLLENDVNLAALGIKHSGVAKGVDNVLVVFIGTGVGGGLIFNGSLYRGTSFVAGEIGHINYKQGGELCGCGKKGCYEAYASRTAMVRDITAEIKDGKKSTLKSFIDAKKMIKSKALANALKEEDKLTVKIVMNACKVTGKVLADINNILNLRMIVLGGGVIEANKDFMMPHIKESFKENSLESSAEPTSVVATILGDDAPLYGGLALTEEFLHITV